MTSSSPSQRKPFCSTNHRRSMSDPNLHKSFSAIKELWDKKVEEHSGKSISFTSQTSWSTKRTASTGLVKPNKKQENIQTKNKDKTGVSKPVINFGIDKSSTDTLSLVKSRARMFDVAKCNVDKTSLISSKNRSETKKRSDEMKGTNLATKSNSVKCGSLQKNQTNNDHQNIDNTAKNPQVSCAVKSGQKSPKKENQIFLRPASNIDQNAKKYEISNLSIDSMEFAKLPRRHLSEKKITSLGSLSKSFLHHSSSSIPSTISSHRQSGETSSMTMDSVLNGNTIQDVGSSSIFPTKYASTPAIDSPRQKSSLHKERSFFNSPEEQKTLGNMVQPKCPSLSVKLANESTDIEYEEEQTGWHDDNSGYSQKDINSNECTLETTMIKASMNFYSSPLAPIKSNPLIDNNFTVTKYDALEIPSRTSLTSENDSCSEDDQSDEEEDGKPRPNFSGLTSDLKSIEDIPDRAKLHNIAKELLKTEESYVAVLHLIDQIFHQRVLEAINKKQISSDVKNIFSNISAIYQFHFGFLLPQLKSRLALWESNPKIGDIMTQAAPFLKMYSLYVQNFHEAMAMIKHWSEKSTIFASIIKETQAMEECKSLSLEHHMLGPVQRIPRYKLLLEDYLKRLPKDSPDRHEAAAALTLISEAANHNNESMRQNDQFNRILNIYNNLVNIDFDMVTVSRELIMEGKIIKISARNGEKHERYLYLFNDMLLCCSPVRRLQKKIYKVTAKIDLEGMEIKNVVNMNISNTFCVNGTNKSMEFAANSADEKTKWISSINDAIHKYLEKKTSFLNTGSQKTKWIPEGRDHYSDCSTDRVDGHSQTPPFNDVVFSGDQDHNTGNGKGIEIFCIPGSAYIVDIEENDLGKRAPRWIKDNEVTMCMNCSKAFNRLLRRRHHCRACGKVICTECSEQKFELAYDPGKLLKVCNKCYAILTGRKEGACDKKGVLQIEADVVSEGSIISEYLLFSESEKRKAWSKRWCVIPRNEPCLYVYGANQDVRAAMTMPLPGFQIVDDNKLDKEFSFKLVQARKVLSFAASSEQQKNKWKDVLEKVIASSNLFDESFCQHLKCNQEVEKDDASKCHGSPVQFVEKDSSLKSSPKFSSS